MINEETLIKVIARGSLGVDHRLDKVPGSMVYCVGREAMYEQLAEESSELAQAALKASRKLRQENPTPKTVLEILKGLIEEVTDVEICLQELGLYSSQDIKDYKYQRFSERWSEYLNNGDKEDVSIL